MSAGRGILALAGFVASVRRPRMVYLDGTVWLMSPSCSARTAEANGSGGSSRIVVSGSTSPASRPARRHFRRRAKTRRSRRRSDLLSGQRERIRGKEKINLKTDPPPDLAIEAVYSHEADAAVEVYRRFKVPEVWVCDEAELVILVLQPNGRYAESATSAAFPFLSASEVFDWVSRPAGEFDNDWIKELRSWVRRTLKPRVRGEQEETLRSEFNNLGPETYRS